MRFNTRRIIAIFVLLAVAFTLPVVDAQPSLAATRLSLSPTNPVHREYIKLAGKFGSGRRPVHLQYWTGSRWASLAKKTTTSTGRFAFTTRAKAPSRKFRAVAPRYRGYKPATTATRTVRTVRPKAAMSFVPAPIAQDKSNTSLTNLTPFSTRFSPARKGRKVLLQRYSGGAWRTVATSRQARNGTSAFKVPASIGKKYRAVTVAYRGAAAVRSASKTARHLSRKFNENFSGSSLNTTHWEYRSEGVRSAASKRACSQSSRKSVSVSGGTLRLKTIEILPTYRWETTDPTPLLPNSGDETTKRIQTNPDYKSGVSCPHGQYYNGHIGTTSSSGHFKRGIMAARIKLQPQRGHHGGFWSQGAGAGGAEIDALEYYGGTAPKARVQHTIYKDHVQQAYVYRDRSYLLGSGLNWANSYHIFSVQWTSTQYIFRIDGTETFRTRRGISTADQNLILSLLSSDYELDEMTANPGPMEVDWVRTWQY